MSLPKALTIWKWDQSVGLTPNWIAVNITLDVVVSENSLILIVLLVRENDNVQILISSVQHWLILGHTVSFLIYILTITRVNQTNVNSSIHVRVRLSDLYNMSYIEMKFLPFQNFFAYYCILLLSLLLLLFARFWHQNTWMINGYAWKMKQHMHPSNRM